MYKMQDHKQLELVDFLLPFGGHLSSNNRWVRLAKIMPWDRIEQIYLASMSTSTGRRAIPARTAFGAIYIKESENLTDEGCVQAILENPYMQYFIGLEEFTETAPFDASMMVHFRKRFPVEEVAKINEFICTGKWPEGARNVDGNDDKKPPQPPKSTGGGKGGKNPNTSKKKEKQRKKQEKSNRGTLIMDATVAPSDIKFPTDIDLLNQCRMHLEHAVTILWKEVPHTSHKLPYSAKKARKSYLNVSKSKKWTRKLLRKGIGEQLEYVRLARQRLNQLVLQVPAEKVDFPSWLWDRLCVIPVVYEQQKGMYDAQIHTCEDRIVSLQQPHVRPVVRGKRPNPTEFGQKLHLSVVDGYTFLEQTRWDCYNEGCDLQAVVEDYFRKFGCYPEAVLADQIYQTRKNRAYCKELEIRLSGPALGRRKQGVTDAQAKRQMYKDSCKRNAVEGRNGNLKRRFGLDLVMSKLDECAKTEAALNILAMNAAYRLQRWLARFFPQLHVLLVFQ